MKDQPMPQQENACQSLDPAVYWSYSGEPDKQGLQSTVCWCSVPLGSAVPVAVEAPGEEEEVEEAPEDPEEVAAAAAAAARALTMALVVAELGQGLPVPVLVFVPLLNRDDRGVEFRLARRAARPGVLKISARLEIHPNKNIHRRNAIRSLYYSVLHRSHCQVRKNNNHWKSQNTKAD